MQILGLPWWLNGKESTCQCRKNRFDPWSVTQRNGMELNLEDPTCHGVTKPIGQNY